MLRSSWPKRSILEKWVLWERGTEKGSKSKQFLMARPPGPTNESSGDKQVKKPGLLRMNVKATKIHSVNKVNGKGEIRRLTIHFNKRAS